MFSFISDVYILICLLFVLFLVIVIIYKAIKKTWGNDFWSLVVTCFGAATAVSFLFGAIDKIFFHGRFLDMDVVRLAVAALVGSVGLSYEGLKRYLKYFGVELERKRKKDKGSK
jgi:hypothetical protein